MIMWLLLGVLSGVVYQQHNRIKRLEGIASRQPTPTVNAVDFVNTASDSAARAVDKHVQEFHRGGR